MTMTAPDIIHQLVERFEQHYDTYRSGKYNETQLRREFLDPFFEALGWDVFNRQGYAEMYKDVIHEDSLEIEGGNKAPDYAFRIGGARKFFVEAKKPAVNIQDNIHPAYQLRRYAWSAKLPLGILTDFEEFAVYDCRVKPDKADKASTGRVRMFSFREYAEKWDEIAAVFSREAVLKGSFDQYAEGLKGKKGTAEVDDAFLAEIERWRDLLARNIALRNPSLSARELNYAVQITIDRIVFLRICEDRGVESDYQLREISAGGNVYPNLTRLFQRADARYNSGLFHFKDEKGQSSAADSLTLNLKIDDKVLQDILRNLYYPESPYVFREIPSDILGQVYERFLGKVIRLTAGHQAKVEEKPEVRKAGGVYYTPTYIVDYIVQNTVGKLLEGMTPKQAASLRILDPACGSGTFPLGAYQFLLDWHLKWYVEHDLERSLAGRNPVLYEKTPSAFGTFAQHTVSAPKSAGKKTPQSPSRADLGEAGRGYRLTTAEKKRILVNNIFGVDIDPQAVEVTKLSLLLKVLEGESNETIGSQLSLLQERVLPDLGRNIQCGNSLIGPDYYEGQQLTMGGFVDEDERARVNVFDWKAAFPQVFIQGGFDVVVGNPPYIRIQGLQETSPIDVEFYKKRYKAASKGNYDIYVVFVEKGLSLLNTTGRLGYILPHKFFNAQYGEPVRSVIANGKHLAKVVHFGAQQVFKNATTYTCLLFLDGTGRDEFEFEKVKDLEAWKSVVSSGGQSDSQKGKIKSNRASYSEWNFSVGDGAELIEKMSDSFLKLDEVMDIFVGLQTSADDVFMLDVVEEKTDSIRLKSKALNKEWVFEKDLLFPIVSGTDVVRYRDLPERQYVLFPYEIKNEKANLIDFAYIQNHFPKTAEYLLANKKVLEEREKGKMKGARWYGYIYLKNMTRQTIRKLCVPRLVDRLYATYDFQAIHFLDNVDVGGLSLKPAYEEQGYLYLLGLLNSKLLTERLIDN